MVSGCFGAESKHVEEGERMAKKKEENRSAEPWEVERMHREFPVKSEKELERAVQDCKKQGQRGRERQKLTDCVERKISR